MKLFRINSVGTALRALLGWPLLVLGAYFLAAMVGSAIPVNHSWSADNDQASIYLHDNGIHTSVIIPDSPDKSALAVAFPPAGGDKPHYRMFGWGDREFYLNTPTWGDISPATAVAALVGSGQTLLHVDDLDDLPDGAVRLNVSHATQQYIVAQIIAARAEAEPIKGYGAKDRFYSARGYDYSIFYTCNNWVSGLLREAGIKTGLWTPLPFGVMWWYE